MIREDLTAARFSRCPPGSHSPACKQRRRVFVGLGSALEGLCLYLHQEEVAQLRLACSRDTATRILLRTSLRSTPKILAVVCIDPPPYLWKTCGRSILDQASIHGIPSFFVGYTEKDEDGVEQIPTELGQLLNDCRQYPHALALVAKDSARALNRPINSNAKDKNRDFDACVWMAKLVGKYSESVQRIRSPPGCPSSDTTSMQNEGSVRSML